VFLPHSYKFYLLLPAFSEPNWHYVLFAAYEDTLDGREPLSCPSRLPDHLTTVGAMIGLVNNAEADG
jgi:hypothetical protein